MASEGGNESQITSSYAQGPPWLFKGRALYQLHLVKADTARELIPKELKLVEAFGYTLGGLFFARYDASPAGAFDELVVIPGIVWNPPTSCAWAARVLVSSREAREHGRKEVGLPSHFAEFLESSQTGREQGRAALGSTRPGSAVSIPGNRAETLVNEVADDGVATPLCSISLPFGGALKAREGKTWMGPNVNFSLPSYSGRTVHNPNLLKYSCRVMCRVRLVEPAWINLGQPSVKEGSDGGKMSEVEACQPVTNQQGRGLVGISDVLQSKPVLALEFSSLEMLVGAPFVVPPLPGTAPGSHEIHNGTAVSGSSAGC